MSEHRPPDFESLEPPLKAAVKAALAELIPEDAIERVKVRARQLSATTTLASPTPGSHHGSWRLSRSMVTGLTAAAALLAVVTGFLLMDHVRSRAFAEMIERVKAASSVRFTTATRFGSQSETSGVMYVEGNRVRFEQFDGMLIQVADLDRKQALFLDMHRKVAQPAEIDDAVVREFANPIDQLRHAKFDDAEPIGQEIIEGRRTRVYRLDKIDLLGIGRIGQMLVWIDVESGLPARITIRNHDLKFPMEFRFEQFVWNERLEASLFSLTIPDGFQTGIVTTVPASRKPTPADAPSAEDPSGLVSSLLSHDRVPARIIWGLQGETITALMRDPESVPSLERQAHELRQWDVATGKLRWSEAVAGAGWVAGSADGKFLATVIGYEVQLREAATGRIIRTWATEQRLSPLAFSPDGRVLAAGISEWGRFGGKGGKPSGGVQFWDIEQATLVRSIPDDKPTAFLRYSVDGEHLATSANEGPVKLWDVATGELTRIFPDRTPADFSPDGETIACASTDPADEKRIGRVNLYELKNGSLVTSFVSQEGATASWLLCVVYSPNGRLLAASDWNGTVTLWDVATGRRIETITDHEGGVLSAAFSPDGTTLATGGEDGTLRLRKLPAVVIEPKHDKR